MHACRRESPHIMVCHVGHCLVSDLVISFQKVQSKNSNILEDLSQNASRLKRPSLHASDCIEMCYASQHYSVNMSHLVPHSAV